MRKIMVFLMAIVFVLGMTATARALPFDSMGWVDPNYDDGDTNDLTGTARYYFNWDNPNVNVTELNLQFEGDIFDLGIMTALDFAIQAPAGWSTYIYEETGILHWSISGGVGINYTQDPIILDVDYTLQSVSRYYFGNNVAAGDSEIWAWNEAQGANSPWVQKYTLKETIDIPGYGTYTVNDSPGSTAPVPEPASLLLLGSGLLGLAAFGGLRRKKS